MSPYVRVHFNSCTSDSIYTGQYDTSMTIPDDGSDRGREVNHAATNTTPLLSNFRNSAAASVATARKAETASIPRSFLKAG